VKPARLFITMTAREVPTAAGMARPAQTVKAGTIRKPPLTGQGHD